MILSQTVYADDSKPKYPPNQTDTRIHHDLGSAVQVEPTSTQDAGSPDQYQGKIGPGSDSSIGVGIKLRSKPAQPDTSADAPSDK